MTICLDPGHGMANRTPGVHDSGACAGSVTEAEIAMDWANELRRILLARNAKVIRTRIDALDPAPVAKRAATAKQYGCEIMISIHCNAADGTAQGTETFYRGSKNQAMATALNTALVKVLGTRNRGIKTESESQHSRLAVMAFQPCYLIELGFLDHAADRAKLLDSTLRTQACEALAGVLLA